MFSVATWNVNSIKVRLPIVLEWLQKNQPDILMLQEIKCLTGAFPADAFTAIGYASTVSGQAGYNGVAILSKDPVAEIHDRLPGYAGDTQARFLQIAYHDWILINIYAPNGNPVESDKFSYKLAWLEHLRTHCKTLLKTRQKLLIAGDFNIIPELIDARHPEQWRYDALFQPESRKYWRSLCHSGMTDAYRALHPADDRAYTFWDYQAGSWHQDNGIRIDHIMVSPQGADTLTGCRIDKEPRGMERPSDHTPIIATFRK